MTTSTTRRRLPAAQRHARCSTMATVTSPRSAAHSPWRGQSARRVARPRWGLRAPRRAQPPSLLLRASERCRRRGAGCVRALASSTRCWLGAGCHVQGSHARSSRPRTRPPWHERTRGRRRGVAPARADGGPGSVVVERVVLGGALSLARCPCALDAGHGVALLARRRTVGAPGRRAGRPSSADALNSERAEVTGRRPASGAGVRGVSTAQVQVGGRDRLGEGCGRNGGGLGEQQRGERC